MGCIISGKSSSNSTKKDIVHPEKKSQSENFSPKSKGYSHKIPNIYHFFLSRNQKKGRRGLLYCWSRKREVRENHQRLHDPEPSLGKRYDYQNFISNEFFSSCFLKQVPLVRFVRRSIRKPVFRELSRSLTGLPPPKRTRISFWTRSRFWRSWFCSINI